MSQFGPNIKPQIVVKDEITVFIRKKNNIKICSLELSCLVIRLQV